MGPKTKLQLNVKVYQMRSSTYYRPYIIMKENQYAKE
jgi:hypothetical protein